MAPFLECHEASKHHLLEFGFFLDSINLGFLLRENLLLCSSYLSLGVPNWTVIYINTVPHHHPSPCSARQMDEHLSGVSTRHDGRSCPTTKYSQTACRTAKYRMVGAGGRRDGGVQATGRRIDEGWCRRRQSNERRKRGICDQIVGFACFLADRAGPSPLFSHPESPRPERVLGG
jgi:hypothetical protein